MTQLINPLFVNLRATTRERLGKSDRKRHAREWSFGAPWISKYCTVRSEADDGG